MDWSIDLNHEPTTQSLKNFYLLTSSSIGIKILLKKTKMKPCGSFDEPYWVHTKFSGFYSLDLFSDQNFKSPTTYALQTTDDLYLNLKFQ